MCPIQAATLTSASGGRGGDSVNRAPAATFSRASGCHSHGRRLLCAAASWARQSRGPLGDALWRKATGERRAID